MHELAIARGIVELVADHARRDAFDRVRSVHLSIGALAHVDPRALEFAFDAVARGTAAEGARLDIERPPAQAWCTDCNSNVTIAAHGDPCPRCAGARWLLRGGDEMRVIDLEVE